jgi:hypothetical protein
MVKKKWLYFSSLLDVYIYRLQAWKGSASVVNLVEVVYVLDAKWTSVDEMIRKAL